MTLLIRAATAADGAVLVGFVAGRLRIGDDPLQVEVVLDMPLVANAAR